jgi:nitrogenase molybdenum-iron protein NifN
VRRYVISHFKEPIDIASSSFSESTAVFGGKDNLKLALDTVVKQYDPLLIGVATTCLSETIGDDVPRILQEYVKERAEQKLPHIIHVSTPSYKGTHMEGFHAAVKAVVDKLAEGDHKSMRINIFPGFVSAADIRHLKEILSDFKLPFSLFPDYSETLDAPAWDSYQVITKGGTSINEIKAMGEAYASIEFGRTLQGHETAADLLKKRFGVERYTLGTPIGIGETDIFFKALETISGTPTPEKYVQERGRLVDSYFDAHKYVFGKKAVVYGEEDFVIAMAVFLAETGITPVLCATGAENGRLAGHLYNAIPQLKDKILAREGVDFMEIAEEARTLAPDILIGNSKGYPLARELNIPLIRVGFPIHDRVGGQRILHLGYRGAQSLFDTITNSLIKSTQDKSPVGYMYM